MLSFPMEGDSTPERAFVNTSDVPRETGRTTANFEQVVVSDTHHLFATVDNDGSLFDDAARANNDRPSKCKDGSLGMNDRAWSDGDVAFEIDILTNDRF